jgi:Uma2 family endonuclease
MSAIIKKVLLEDQPMLTDVIYTPAGKAMTEAEFLAFSAQTDGKYEYINGLVFAMATPSTNHNRISGNFYGKFWTHLQGKPCEAMMADMMAKAAEDYFCPDVLVVCDHNRKAGITDSPIIVVEVLSPSTRYLDETEKLLKYINLPTLQEYVMVEQDVVSIKLLRKRNDWRIELYSIGTSVTFESIGLTLTVEEIYDRVDNDEISEHRLKQPRNTDT